MPQEDKMIQVYKKVNKSVIEVDPELIVEGYDFTEQWIHMSNPTDKEIELVCSSCKIPEDYVKAALDSEERAHCEKEDGILMAVTDIPITEEDDDRYTYATLPFGCITTESTIVTVCLNETSIINDLMAGRYVKDFNIHKRTRFVLQLQYVIAKKYLQYLKQIDRASQRVQAELEKAMKNEGLIEMLSLENPSFTSPLLCVRTPPCSTSSRVLSNFSKKTTICGTTCLSKTDRQSKCQTSTATF